ncbi:hypothetical protein ACJX0J_025832, partial [Zea mays]
KRFLIFFFISHVEHTEFFFEYWRGGINLVFVLEFWCLGLPEQEALASVLTLALIDIAQDMPRLGDLDRAREHIQHIAHNWTL